MSVRRSQTFSILEELKPDDWSGFKDYLASPFFFKPRGKAAVLPDFVAVLCEHYIEGNKKNAKTPDYEDLWWALYANKKVDRARINNLLVELEKHLNTFFAHRSLKDNEQMLNKVLVLGYLNQRNPDSPPIRKYVGNKLKKFEDKLVEGRNEATDDWYYKYRLQVENSKFFNKEDDTNGSLNKLLVNLDVFYVLERLKFTCVSLDRREVLNSKAKGLELKAFKGYLKDIKPALWEESSIFRLYYHLFMGLTEEEGKEAHYEQLEMEFLGASRKISNLEQTNFRYVIINYYVRKINQGDAAYKEKLHLFFEELLNRELIIFKGKLEDTYYRNIVLNALGLGEWAWTEKFVEDYRDKIRPLSRAKDTYAYSKALLVYNKKHPDYDEAIEWLNKMESKHVFLEIWRRSLQVRVLYDSNEGDFVSFTNSFNAYVGKKDLGERGKNYRTFLKLLVRIMKRPFFDKTETFYKRLREDIEKEKNLINKQWLIDKLEEKSK